MRGWRFSVIAMPLTYYETLELLIAEAYEAMRTVVDSSKR